MKLTFSAKRSKSEQNHFYCCDCER